MKDWIIFIVIFFILLYIYKTNYRSYIDIKKIKSLKDHNEYIIRESSRKTEVQLQDSADTLAEINTRVLLLIQHLENSKSLHTKDNKTFIRMLRQNYNQSIISEAAVDERFTTYTINKEEMHICLRTRDQKEELYDIDLLMYVVLHELAHLCNFTEDGEPIIGHGSEFKRIFRILVEESVKIGIYRYTNYYKKPAEYCGMTINTTILPK